MLNLTALTTETVAPTEGREIAAAYAAKDAQLKSLQGELTLLKEQLADATHEAWLTQNSVKLTPSIFFEGVNGNDIQVGRRRSTKLFPAIPDGADACFDESFKITIDGSKLSPDQRQAAIDAIAKSGITKSAIKADSGFKLKADALPIAIQSGDDVLQSFVEGCFSNTVTVK
jgi:hypothetical protein